MTNLQRLIEQYGGVTLTMPQLAEVLHVKPKSLLNSISAGRCKVPTFREGRRRLATVTDVAAYLDQQGHQ